MLCQHPAFASARRRGSGGVRSGGSSATLALVGIAVGLLGLAAPCSPAPASGSPAARAWAEGAGAALLSARAAHDAGPRAGHGGSAASVLRHMHAGAPCPRVGSAGRGGRALTLRPPPLSPRPPRGDGCGAGGPGGAGASAGGAETRAAAPWALRGAGDGEGTEEMRKGLENMENLDDDDGNQTKATCNTDGGCPHGRHSDNPDEQHCMECEVMAFLQVLCASTCARTAASAP